MSFCNAMVISSPSVKRFRLWCGRIDEASLINQHPDGIDSIRLREDGGADFTISVLWAGGQGSWDVGFTMGKHDAKIVESTFTFADPETTHLIQVTATSFGDLAAHEEFEGLIFPVRLRLDGEVVAEQRLSVLKNRVP